MEDHKKALTTLEILELKQLRSYFKLLVAERELKIILAIDDLSKLIIDSPLETNVKKSFIKIEFLLKKWTKEQLGKQQ